MKLPLLDTRSPNSSDETCAAPSSRREWWAVAAMMFTVAWGGNQFTPLLQPYRDQSGYSQLDVDIFLAAYVFGLVPSLLFAVRVARRSGQRRILLDALFASAAGSALLAAEPLTGYIGMVTGRTLIGLALGVGMAIGTSLIAQLAPAGTGPRRAAVALTSGFALGPAFAGILAQFASHPLLWPYVLHGALCLGSLLGLALVPGRRLPSPPGSSVGLRAALSACDPRMLRRVSPLAPWIFGSAGVAYAILPHAVGDSLGELALMYATAMTVATLATGVVVQPLARRLFARSPRNAVLVAMTLMSVGSVVATVTVATGSALIGGLAALVLGAGYGIALVTGLLEIQRTVGASNAQRSSACTTPSRISASSFPRRLRPRIGGSRTPPC